MQLTTFTTCIFTLCIIYNLLAVNIKEVQAAYGDSCTQVNTSNCTPPQLSCTDGRICNCSQGYLKDTTHGNNITCRKPGFNEGCDTTTGCQEPQQCTNISGSMVCQCYSSEFYDPRTGQCEEKPENGERCDVSIGCADYNECVDDHAPEPPTCQCNSSSVYLDHINNLCFPISDLHVTVVSTLVTATAITFWWDGSNPESGVEYDIQCVPAHGRTYFVYNGGGQVSNLQPGTQYNCTVLSSLSNEVNYPEKIYYGPNMTFCTQVLFGGQCDVCQDCEDSAAVCSQAVDKQSRCLCNDTFFNASQGGTCTSLDELLVTNVSSTSTSSVITFSWRVTTNMSSVKYKIEWFPDGGQVDNISSTGAQVSGLDSGMLYYFTITSVLPGDAYNNEKRVSSHEYTATTKWAHLEVCATGEPDKCQQTTMCVPDVEGVYRCMCGATDYYSDAMGNCSSLEDLKVSAVSVTESARTANFTWTAQIQPASMTYTLVWTPSGGTLDSASSAGAHVSGLSSGTLYNFTIVSVLSPDFYPEKRVYTQFSPVMTKPAFNETCNVTIGCQAYQHCINVSGSMMCQCDSSAEYYNTTSDRCLSKPVTGERCDVSIGCLEYSECVDHPPSPPTCLCNSSNVYLDDINSMCLPISDLQVSIASISVTATSVNFGWDGSSPESGVEYNIMWVPSYGRIGYVYPGGGEVIDLLPGTQYTFTIVSSIFGGLYVSEKKYYGPNVTVCTEVLFGGQCDVCKQCEDSGTVCSQAVDKHSRCLCEDTLFNASQDGNCTSLNELTVANITSTSTSSVITLSWRVSTNMSSVKYQIDWFPSGGQVDNITSTGARVSGLGSGIMYYFTISSVLPGDAYNSEKRVSSPEYTTTTKWSHLQNCASYAPEKCQQMMSCVLDVKGTYRCMCGSTDYFSDVMGECSSLKDLQVYAVSVTETARTANFTWFAQIQPASITYTLVWTPSGGKLDSASSAGAHVSGLTSGTLYNFTIVSVLSSDFYPEKRLYTQVSPVMTKPAFNETCNVTIGCQDYQHCINVSGSMVCQCDSSAEYYNTTSDRCLSKPSLGEKCELSIGCEEFYQCVGQPTTCQCNTSYLYLDVYNYQCRPMSDLKVTLLSTTATATTVTLNWVESDPDIGAVYDIQWTPSGGKLNFTNYEGGQVSDLQAGTLYNLTVVSKLLGDPYFPEKKFYGPSVTTCTNVVYGGECTICNVCQDNTTTCMKARDGRNRCLCGSTFYNRTQTGNCSSLNDLMVTDITSKGTISSINFTWPVETHLSSVTYRFSWNPSGGQVDSISSTGGMVSGLTPGTTYYFSIISVLTADAFNEERNVTSPEYLVRTQLIYLSDCVPYTNEECQDMTSCVEANDHMFRCMCGLYSYFNERLQNCSSMDDLKVYGLSVTTTTTTSVLTWKTQQHTPSVTYAIDWAPSDGKLDSINGTSAYLSGLTSGTLYNFSIDSLLLPDVYYPEKSASVLVQVKTETHSGSSGNSTAVGVGVGVTSAVLIIILVAGIVVYKRRVPTRTRLQESYEHENVAGVGDESHHQGHSSHSGHRTETVQSISLENISPTSPAPPDVGDQGCATDDTFDDKDVRHLMKS